ncbi:3-isopropylmalate dehydrogenase [Marinactinospora thermotolerans]|uniref:3-isopropylmalate dehydrogenase n=1 Tax=Marinactinospora thermotolerans DSM 45154 TaxID=1122192 RepID=A0A1T4SEN1_9ACTN|nr:3-isopropylmalate dehydrogenase [Marinactinospora thermotolerans]SKA26780.1 3-isopropylmalate dehydrogenase [Marinactinospora thermotolerans DSM 45154]
MAARTVKLAVIPGDGIGPEVVAEGLKVLSAVAPRHDLALDTTEYELGAKRWHATGETLPDSVEEELRGHDAIFLGAVGDPSVPSGVLERGLLLRLRFSFSHYVNLRPVRLYPGVTTPLADTTPDDIDMLVVREGTEGPYAGMGGVLRKGTPGEIATQDSVNTRFGVERVVRYAFEKAAARPRRKLTLVHKDNVLTFAGELWQRVVREVGEEYPQVSVDYCHVDAATMFFVTQPHRFDVVVTDNLFGDIITDLGAAVAGGIGLAASGNINPEGDFPSMFEPVHGSAPDIAGQGKADPTATILSAAIMLDHLGAADAARRVERAVAEDLRDRAKDAVERSTSRIGDDIAARVAEQG